MNLIWILLGIGMVYFLWKHVINQTKVSYVIDLNKKAETFEVKKLKTVEFMRASAAMHEVIADKMFLAKTTEEIEQLIDEYERMGDGLLKEMPS